MEKAYKLLAAQYDISNQKAKKLCDQGVVYAGNDKIKIARAMLSENTKLNVLQIQEPIIIFEDENIIAINKPPFMNSEDCLKKVKGAELIHRLDKETSGVLLFSKTETFLKQAIMEFKSRRVYKEYRAIVFGVMQEEQTIDMPLLSIKRNNQITTSVSPKGRDAITIIEPIEIIGKKTKLKVVIKTGRSHQIRVHLAHIGYPVVGDEQYGNISKARRVMLHAYKIKLLGYEFEAEAGETFGF